MKHHITHYSFKKPLDVTPFKCDTIYNIPISLIIYAPIILSLYYLLNIHLNYYYSTLIITEVTLLLFISDYIHTNIHIKNSWLEKYSFFIKCRNIHLLHHKNFTKNYSLSGYDNTFDHIFQTNF